MLRRSTIIIFAFVFINLIIRFSWYSSINVVLPSEAARPRYSNIDVSNWIIHRVVFRKLNSPVLGESGLVDSSICHSSYAKIVDGARGGIKAKLFVDISRTSAFLGVTRTSQTLGGYQVVIVLLRVSLSAYQILIHSRENLRRHSFLGKGIGFHLS